jgi:flagellar hook assembly protein FlgD
VTQIAFSLPAESRVKLTIFDILGREIATLADDQRTAGSHTVSWGGMNAAGKRVASGVYFYHLEAKSVSGNATFSNFKKMIYLK